MNFISFRLYICVCFMITKYNIVRASANIMKASIRMNIFQYECPEELVHT